MKLSLPTEYIYPGCLILNTWFFDSKAGDSRDSGCLVLLDHSVLPVNRSKSLNGSSAALTRRGPFLLWMKCAGSTTILQLPIIDPSFWPLRSEEIRVEIIY